jgi:hypothetical protein
MQIKLQDEQKVLTCWQLLATPAAQQRHHSSSSCSSRLQQQLYNAAACSSSSSNIRGTNTLTKSLMCKARACVRVEVEPKLCVRLTVVLPTARITTSSGVDALKLQIKLHQT